jgi:hypothetical protein
MSGPDSSKSEQAGADVSEAVPEAPVATDSHEEQAAGASVVPIRPDLAQPDPEEPKERSADNVTLEVETTYAGMVHHAGGDDDLAAEVAAELSTSALIDRKHVEDEIDLMVRATRTFWEMEPDMVMRTIAALSARCTELSIHLHRVESLHRQWTKIRTMQVEKLLEDLDRQFKIASRMLEVRRQDIDLSR